jgi:hypothetical protein
MALLANASAGGASGWSYIPDVGVISHSVSCRNADKQAVHVLL